MRTKNTPDGGSIRADIGAIDKTVKANATGLDSMNVVVGKSDHIVKSTRRTFQVLEFFDLVRRSATLKEISEHLEIPVSSGSFLLRSMLAMGYLAYDGSTRSFIPTMRVSFLGNWIQHQIHPGFDLAALMKHIHSRCGHTIMAGYLNGLYVQYIHVLQGSTSVRFYLEPGSSRLAIRSTLGWTLLSLKPDQEVQRIWLHAREYVDSNVTTNLDVIRHGIADVREKGFVRTKSLGTAGVGVIAAPLSSVGHHPAIAVGIGGPNDMIEDQADALATLLLETIKHAMEPRHV